MTRLTGLVTHNWPLKVAAIALATLLYAGLALSQNARTWPGRVPIEAVDQPAGAFLLESLGDVTSIRYYAPADVAARISSSDFQAIADLSGVSPTQGGTPVSVPVEVIPLDPRIKVLDFQPDRVAVRLDPVVTRTVPISVDRGTIPAGLAIGDPTLSAQTATVRGASSLVERVETASARVAIDPTGINVDGEVDLVALDARGDVVAPVDIEPDRVHVTIVVGRESASRSVPVAPALTGAPAAGWSVRSVTVDPVVVTVRGALDAIAAMDSVATARIPLDGRTTDLTTTVDLVAPAGVEIVDAGQANVTVEIAADRGSRSFGVGLRPTGGLDGRTYSLSVPDVLVTLGGTSAALAAVDPAALSASVPVGDLAPGTHTVEVVFREPSGTNLVALTPGSVTVVVSTGPAPSPGPSISPTP
ncbi:MAG TPA: CdaR family protein [Candidatus Limnocylindrales bacterium]